MRESDARAETPGRARPGVRPRPAAGAGAHAPTPARVLFLARYLDAGGVTTYMKTLAMGLRQQGVEVALASRGQVEEHAHGPAWFARDGVEHFEVSFPRRLATPSAVPDALRALREVGDVVRRFRPDLLHVHWRSVSPYARLIEYAGGIPFVTTLHQVDIPSGPLHRLVSCWGARTICVSRGVRAFLVQAFAVPPGRVCVIPNGVDADHFRPPSAEERARARSRFGLRSDERVVVLVGSLYPRKGHGVLIRALAALHARGVEATALLAGAGDPEPITQLAARHGVADRVRVLGHADARSVLWCADAFALPSYREGFGTAVAEAMLCGVVPIRTPTAGSEEQIEDGVNGFLIPFDDPAALARRLERVLLDAPLRARMAEAALAVARRRFTGSVMVEQTLDVYRDVLATRPA